MERLWMVTITVLALTFSACGQDEDGPKGEGSAESGQDYCEVFGWYNDGHCDDVCARPDPDCSSGENASPGTPSTPGNPGRPTTPVPDPEPEPEPWCENVDIPRDYFAMGDECEFIDFDCDNGEPFWDECGCGCEYPEDEPGPECDYDDRFRDYVATSPEECSQVRFSCEDPNLRPFSDECGCGCEIVVDGGPLACLPDTPDLNRMFDEEECLLADFICEEGWYRFEDDCGCGCRLECSDDFECPNGYCAWEGASDAPNACVYPNCDDGTNIVCMNPPPDCYDSDVLSVVNGCWECRDARTCGPSNGP